MKNHWSITYYFIVCHFCGLIYGDMDMELTFASQLNHPDKNGYQSVVLGTEKHRYGYQLQASGKHFHHTSTEKDGVRLGCYGYELDGKQYITQYVADARGYRLVTTEDLITVYPKYGDKGKATFSRPFNVDEEKPGNARYIFPKGCKGIDVQIDNSSRLRSLKNFDVSAKLPVTLKPFVSEAYFYNTPPQNYPGPNHIYAPNMIQVLTARPPNSLPIRPPNTYLPPVKPESPVEKPNNEYLPPEKPNNNYLPPEKPGNDYKPTQKPSNCDKPSRKPENSYKPSQKPESSSKPTQKPYNRPKPTQKPQISSKPPQKPQENYKPQKPENISKPPLDNTYLPPQRPINAYLPPKPNNTYLPPPKPTSEAPGVEGPDYVDPLPVDPAEQNSYLPPPLPNNTYLPPFGQSPPKPDGDYEIYLFPPVCTASSDGDSDDEIKIDPRKKVCCKSPPGKIVIPVLLKGERKNCCNYAKLVLPVQYFQRLDLSQFRKSLPGEIDTNMIVRRILEDLL